MADFASFASSNQYSFPQQALVQILTLQAHEKHLEDYMLLLFYLCHQKFTYENGNSTQPIQDR